MVALLVPLLVLVVVLIVVAVATAATASTSASPATGNATRFFLILLRLSIGWHFLFEAAEKFNNPSWSSEGYLREASGPLAPTFHALAGDRLKDRLTIDKDGKFPALLGLEWDEYLDRFVAFYKVPDEQEQLAQAKRAHAKLEQAKEKTRLWLTVETQMVKLPSLVPPPVEAPMTVPQRIHLYESYLAKAEDILAKDDRVGGKDPQVEAQKVRAEANRIRSELRKDLNKQTQSMIDDLRMVLKSEKTKAAGTAHQVGQTLGARALAPGAGPMASLVPVLVAAQVQEDGAFALTMTGPTENRGPPPVTRPPFRDWSRLDWSDFLIKWGLLAIGVCLLVGLFTRSACVGGAIFLLSFFLAMPPLPGLLESPKAEGHYVYINKNIVEMLALLALATTRSGRWLGLDALLQFLNPRTWRRRGSPTLPPLPAYDETVRPAAPVGAVEPSASPGSSKEIIHGS